MTQPESSEIAKLIASRFIERRDTKAVQTDDGGYAPVRVNMKDTSSESIPWRLTDVIDHVEGRQTYGHYVVSAENACRCIVFDIDLRPKAKPERGQQPIVRDGVEIDPRSIWTAGDSPTRRELAQELRIVAEAIAPHVKKFIDDQPVMVTYSGCKGMHVYGCLEPKTPASDARQLIDLILQDMEGMLVPEHGNNFFRVSDGAYDSLSIEVFPKQEDVRSGGYGNLVRLPLGINRKSGKPGMFLDLNTPIDKFKIDDPIAALTHGSLR